jgi:homocysteine S-methyltransferase
MTQSFREALADAPMVADGAMGTMLYERGVLYTTNYDELCLSRPALVRRIHADYLRAGAQILETNTFGANRFRLLRHGFESSVRDINVSGARLARAAMEETGTRAFVAGSVGPTGLNLKGLPESERAAIRVAFEEQVEGLVDGGVDLIAIETMRQPDEVRYAIEAAKAKSTLPVMALVSFDAFGTMADGTPPEKMAELLATWGADVIGVNCGDGPSGIYEMVERMRGPGLPLAAMPNAGIPRRVEGRFVYMANREYFGVYANRLLKLGVRIIGGCCGTTPEHIKAAVGAVKMRSHGGSGEIMLPTSMLEGGEPLAPPPGVAVTPRAEKSKLAAKLGQAFCVSVEVNPPASLDLTKTLGAVRMLKEGGIDAINIADGPRASARMSNIAMAARVEREVGVETILHVCCRDRNVLGLVSHVLGAHELGIRNLVIITGDPPKMGDYPECTAVYDMDSVGLINMVRGFNHGRDPGGKPIGGATKFLLTTGAEPAAMDYDREMAKLRRKVEAGAEAVLTQPVYDPAVLDRFLRDVEPLGIPVMVGILPLASHRNAEFLHNEVPGMRIPDAVRDRMRRAGTGTPARKEGVAIAREMLGAVRDRVAGAYIMPPLERYEAALEVIDGFV